MPDIKPGPAMERAVPDVWLRIHVTLRRARFAALLSDLTGASLDRAWSAFRPLPAPDGPWGIPNGNPDVSRPAARGRRPRLTVE